MKPLVSAVAASTLLAATILFLVAGHAASTPPRPAMSITIVSVRPPTVTAKHATVTLHLRVKGIVLDATHMGKANVRGHGHIQLYVDRIPRDAYVRKDLKQHWLASLATTTLALHISPMLVGGPGKHRIIVALAQNNDVLYRMPAASVAITVEVIESPRCAMMPNGSRGANATHPAAGVVVATQMVPRKGDIPCDQGPTGVIRLTVPVVLPA